MQKIIQLLLFILFYLSAMSLHAAGGQVEVLPKKIELGKVMEGEVVNGSFEIVNRGDGVLNIKEIHSPCGCTIANYTSGNLLPGEKVSIDFTVDTSGKQGEVRKKLVVESDDPDQPGYEFFVYMNVEIDSHRTLDMSVLFEGDCANCHALPAVGEQDEALFEAVCYMCHGHYGLGGLAKPINDYEYLYQKDASYFKEIISNGIEGSSMPAFALGKGGPLNEQQINSLVDLIMWWKKGYVFRKNAQQYE